MSRTVGFEDVATQVERYGPLACLTTIGTGEAPAPHVGTVLVQLQGESLRVGVGSTTRGNVRAHPAVTLSWLSEGVDYQLILDGTATVADDPGPDGLYPMTIRVDRGILHRLAGRAGAGPSCLALADGAVC